MSVNPAMMQMLLGRMGGQPVAPQAQTGVAPPPQVQPGQLAQQAMLVNALRNSVPQRSMVQPAPYGGPGLLPQQPQQQQPDMRAQPPSLFSWGARYA